MEPGADESLVLRMTLASAVAKGVRYCGVLLCTFVALFSYRYVVKLGLVPSNVLANRFFDHWIVVHAGTASTALLLGILQLSGAFRQRWPGLHRACGWLYVLNCIVGGVSGVVLSTGVSSGPMAAAGFGVLGVMWVYVTVQGLLTARAKDFSQHRVWMIRSYALTFAAVTLRIYLPISQMTGIDFITAYQYIAWLAWVPNVLIAEAYIRKRICAKPARGN
jgi:hypothetical protein